MGKIWSHSGNMTPYAHRQARVGHQSPKNEEFTRVVPIVRSQT